MGQVVMHVAAISAAILVSKNNAAKLRAFASDAKDDIGFLISEITKLPGYAISATKEGISLVTEKVDEVKKSAKTWVGAVDGKKSTSDERMER